MRSGENSRFSDVCDEPVDHLLIPIKGYQEKELVPLIEAIKPISGFFNGIEDNVFVALHNCQNPADGLDQQESAAIQLYTMQFDGEESLYVLLNQSLRAEDRDKLKPWFPFLKLFLTALYKLPSQNERVWRCIHDVDLSSKYKTGTRFAWWGVSSCTTDIEALNQFLNKHGKRTLFSIDCINGKSVANHSYYKKEKEIILMPGSYFEVMGQLNVSPEVHIIHLKEILPPITLVKPPFSKSTNISSSSIVDKTNTFSQSTSTMIEQNTHSDVILKDKPSKTSMNHFYFFKYIISV